MPRLTAGRRVVDSLERGGVRHAFTVPGESFLEVLDALRDSSIRLVATRHEAGAGFMAEGYAQLTGRPAVCLVTRAVGTANLSIALHTARADSAPLVAIAGQVPRSLRGREAFQEADLVSTFGGLCKAAAELDDPATIGEAVAALVRQATDGRPGPVLLSLPEDVLLEEAGEENSTGHATPDAFGVPSAGPETPDREAVATILRRLVTARRPVVLAGAGVLRARAVADLVAFAEAADVPVMSAWRRPDVFPNDSPRYLGSTGLSAPRNVRRQLLDADVVLALGTRLSEVATFEYAVPAETTTLLHVDVEPLPAAPERQASGNEGVERPTAPVEPLPGARPRPPAVSLRADTRAFLTSALELLRADPGLRPPDRSGQIAGDRAAYLAASELPETGPRHPGDPVHPASIVGALARRMPPDAIVVTDAGNFAGWAARHLRLPPGARFLGPTSGAMGYALPAAIGAGIAARDVEGRPRRAIALAGDGGLAMLMAELETAVRERLPLTVVVFDNGMYGTIRMHQERAHPGRVAGTDLGRIDFARVAQACGARGIRVEHDRDVDAAICEALEAPGTSLVHALTDPRVLSVDETLPG